MPIWCRLLRQAADRPLSLTRASAGSSSAARMPMMAITTSSSMSVNARFAMPAAPLSGRLMESSPALQLILDLFHQRRQFGFGLRRALAVESVQPDQPDFLLQFRTQRRRTVVAIILRSFAVAVFETVIAFLAKVFQRLI